MGGEGLLAIKHIIHVHVPILLDTISCERIDLHIHVKAHVTAMAYPNKIDFWWCQISLWYLGAMVYLDIGTSVLAYDLWSQRLHFATLVVNPVMWCESDVVMVQVHVERLGSLQTEIISGVVWLDFFLSCASVCTCMSSPQSSLSPSLSLSPPPLFSDVSKLSYRVSLSVIASSSTRPQRSMLHRISRHTAFKWSLATG